MNFRQDLLNLIVQNIDWWDKRKDYKYWCELDRLDLMNSKENKSRIDIFWENYSPWILFEFFSKLNKVVASRKSCPHRSAFPVLSKSQTCTKTRKIVSYRTSKWSLTFTKGIESADVFSQSISFCNNCWSWNWNEIERIKSMIRSSQTCVNALIFVTVGSGVSSVVNGDWNAISSPKHHCQKSFADLNFSFERFSIVFRRKSRVWKKVSRMSENDLHCWFCQSIATRWELVERFALLGEKYRCHGCFFDDFCFEADLFTFEAVWNSGNCDAW